MKIKLTHVQEILRGLQPNERFFSIDEYGPFAIKVKGDRMRVEPGTDRPAFTPPLALANSN